MAKRKVFPWFRVFTFPTLIAGVGLTIAAAGVSSPTLMFTAAALSAAGLISIFVGRYLMNDPDPPIVHRVDDVVTQTPKPEHAAIAHR
jgi:hypothetical protein